MKTHFRLFFLLALVSLLLPAVSSARNNRLRTTRPRLRPDTATLHKATPSDIDTIAGPTHAISISGYEKTLRSTRESFFAANNLTGSRIISITLTIDYRDMAGNQLHQRSVTIPADIPPGQRRQLYFPTWDKHHVMYYHSSAPPRTSAQATPYTVTLSPSQILTRPDNRQPTPQ